MNTLRNELEKFSSTIVEIGGVVTDNRVEKLEAKIGYVFPPKFKQLLKAMNSFSLYGTEVYGFGKCPVGFSLEELYHIEHFEVGNPMPESIVPFSPDGGGNHYCLNLAGENPEQVLFWVHDLELSDEEQLEVCGEDIVDWMNKEVIEPILEDYNYDGSEK